MDRRTVLEKAIKCVCEEREQHYGTPENNFGVIANLWVDYLQGRGYPVDIDSVDVALMMALFKIARLSTGTNKEDSFVDACGYLSCAAECSTRCKRGEYDGK